MENREHKGKSLIDFPGDYIVIDTDCTGYYYGIDELVGISALKIRDGNIADAFHSLIKPEDIEEAAEWTFYSEKALSEAPAADGVLKEFKTFIGDDILIGHNVNFDINFIYDYMEPLGLVLDNDYIDTLRISRRLLSSLEHHRLSDMTSYFGIPNNDCKTVSEAHCVFIYELFTHLKDEALKQYADLDSFKAAFKKKKKPYGLKASNFKPADFVADEDNPFFRKYVTFTGALEKMPRKDAMQIVANMGGVCKDTVIEKTNYLVLGDNDYNPILKGKKSSKLIKAEKMKADGKDIEILPESIFYDLLNEWYNGE